MLIQNTGTSASNNDTISVSFPQGNASGNLLAAVYSESTLNNFSGIFDTRGNTWISGVHTNDGVDRRIIMFYAENCSSGANTVTIKTTSSTSNQVLDIIEFSGIRRTGSLDKVASNSTFTSNWWTAPVSITFARELLLNGMTYVAAGGPNTGVPGPDFTEISGARNFIQYRFTNITGQYQATGNMVPAGNRAISNLLMTFKEVEGSPILTSFTSPISYTGQGGYERLKFIGSAFMQVNSTGVIGGDADATTAIKFDNPTLSLNVNDRLTFSSDVASDTGIFLTLTGRDVGGVVQSETNDLMGTTLITGTVTFKHLLRVTALTHSGTISIRKASDGQLLTLIPQSSSFIKNLFSRTSHNTTTYEKIFLKNTSYSNAILNATILESTNPGGTYSFALANSKNDDESVSGISVAPTGCTAFSNASKAVPGGFLNTGECIGVWIKCESTGQGDLSYGLSCFGSIPNSGEREPPSGFSPRFWQSGMIEPGDIVYSGSFKVPWIVPELSGFNYGGDGLAYNPNNNSLFMAGHIYARSIGEVGIPTLVKLTGSNTFDNLNEATLLQTPICLDSRLQTYDLEGQVTLGGFLVIGDKLIATYHEYYDGDGDAAYSHLSVSPYNLHSGAVSGLYPVNWPGVTAGYMCTVPLEHTGVLGTKYLTGQGSKPIISRGSAGPGILGFDPNNLINSGVPVTQFLYYNIFSSRYPGTISGPDYTTFTTVEDYAGAFFPDGSRSLIFIGRVGLGGYCYGDSADCGDICNNYKGPHSYPYTYRAFVYPLSGLVAVKSGTLPTYGVPHAVWHFPIPNETTGCIGQLFGVAWDSGNRRLFVRESSLGAGGQPAIHVYRVGIPTGTGG